ncbi:MAG TPA: hypothetical protein VGM77_11105 [Gemmatimonadales bacterium]
MSNIHISTAVAELTIAAVSLLVGYFKMYLPLCKAIARLEALRETDKEQWQVVGKHLESIDNKLGAALIDHAALKITVLGIDGTNGIRGQIADLKLRVGEVESECRALEMRVTRIEPKS